MVVDKHSQTSKSPCDARRKVQLTFRNMDFRISMASSNPRLKTMIEIIPLLAMCCGRTSCLKNQLGENEYSRINVKIIEDSLTDT